MIAEDNLRISRTQQLYAGSEKRDYVEIIIGDRPRLTYAKLALLPPLILRG
jgi:hypothetical protein